jgi:predicted Zn-dependent peptidase
MIGRAGLIFAVFMWSAAAWDLAGMEKAVAEFTLDNDLHLLILERPDAPLVSFHTCANVGSADDPKGRTGLTHVRTHCFSKARPGSERQITPGNGKL